jgi:predicted glycoside hydrolase/deacetylase ChbG (UPF0249 family)
MNEAASRRIRLCADDYGISEGVNRAIRDLIARRRINATSVMVTGPAATRDEIAALLDVTHGNNCAIGLHVTLTAPFHPLTMHFRPLEGDAFLPLGALLRAATVRRLDREMIEAEIAAQLAAFAALLGRAPDYADGHQHVQIFPQVRDAFLAAVKNAAPGAWVRQCGRVAASSRSGGNLKATLKTGLLDTLSRSFRRRCARAGVAFNPAFAGAYDHSRATDFGEAMDGFLASLPDDALVMCHPGFVDETLRRLDPLTDQREREYAYLAGDEFPRLLAARGVALV